MRRAVRRRGHLEHRAGRGVRVPAADRPERSRSSTSPTPRPTWKPARPRLAAAQKTPQGRARLALVAALGDTPGWFTPLSPEPAATDYAAQEQNQFLWDTQVTFPFVLAFRAELEARAGGNVSWNTGVNYFTDLAKSADLKEVAALYKAAGLSLTKDLLTLNSAPRISAKPSAVAYLAKNIAFNGDISIPVLTMHTTGDGLVVPENEQAYRSVVDRDGNGNLLRQIFVNRAGHCAFTPAETITAVQTLLNRLSTGHWNVPSPAGLNAEAASLGPQLNVFASSGSTTRSSRPRRPSSATPRRGTCGRSTCPRRSVLPRAAGEHGPFRKRSFIDRTERRSCPPSSVTATRPRRPPSACTAGPGRTARSPRRCRASRRSRAARRAGRTGRG